MEYSSGGLWGQQIRDFIQEKVYNNGSSGLGAGNGSDISSSGNGSSSVPESEKVVLVGNSLGGYACMNAAVNCPEYVR